MSTVAPSARAARTELQGYRGQLTGRNDAGYDEARAEEGIAPASARA